MPLYWTHASDEACIARQLEAAASDAQQQAMDVHLGSKARELEALCPRFEYVANEYCRVAIARAFAR